jgi:type IV secretion system protein VirD4
MVSRQETARPLLTPGEVMQLPADEAVIQISGVAPIRVRKIRYYSDPQLAGRVASPPKVLSPIVQGFDNAWACVVAYEAFAGGRGDAADEGGLQQERDLPGLEADVTAKPTDNPPWEDADDTGDEGQQAEQARRFRATARQAALDPDDGIPL